MVKSKVYSSSSKQTMFIINKGEEKRGSKEEGLYNGQKQILNNNKQWVSELIKPLHYKTQLWIINKQIKLN